MAFTLIQVLEWTGGRLANAEASAGARPASVSRLSGLSGSGREDLSFFFSQAYQHELPGAAPGILVTGELFVRPLEAAGLPLWKTSAVIACRDPYFVMALLSEKFAEKASTTAHVGGSGQKSGQPAEIHPSAAVHPSAQVGLDTRIGAGCVIEEGAVIGERCVLYPGCFVGPLVKIGPECVLFPRVTLYEWTELGARVRVHAGAVLGADGFGYAPILEGGGSGQSASVRGHRKIHHLGRVIVGDDVEIGANTCIDRGTIADTVISKNAKIDNLVQVGHNVRIDEGAIICGCVALAGSSSVGKYAYIAGIAGIANQVHIGDGAKVAALSLVSKDVPPGGTAVGNPQRDHKEFFKVQAMLSRMLAERKARRSKPGQPDPQE